MKRKFSFALIYQKFSVLVLFAIIFIAAMIIEPFFIKPANLINLLRQIVVITLIACGGCFMLITAQINVAYDGLIPAVGCTACLVMRATGNVFLAVLAGLVLGAGAGYLFGCAVTHLKVPSFLAGLAVSSVAGGLIMVVTGGVIKMDLGDFTFIGKGNVGPIPFSVFIMIAVMLICHFILTRTTFGRRVFAVGGNRRAAIASGIKADRVQRIVYVLDGLTCATAAIIYMSRIGSCQPNSGKGYAFDAITGAVIGGCSIYGGKGNILGCLFGAGIVGILDNLMGLMGIKSHWQTIASGLIILLAVVIDMATKEAAARASKNLMNTKAE